MDVYILDLFVGLSTTYTAGQANKQFVIIYVEGAEVLKISIGTSMLGRTLSRHRQECWMASIFNAGCFPATGTFRG